MRGRIFFAGGVLFALIAGGCAQQTLVSRTEAGPIAEPTDESFARYPMRVCQTDRVTFRETPREEGEMSEDEVRKMYDTSPSVILHGRVTAGNTAHQKPSPETVASTADGRRLEDVSAWVVVRENLDRFIAGPAPVGDEDPSTRDKKYITAMADVIDARTGVALHGWACATRTEFTDGRELEQRGVDPDKQETRESQPDA